MELEEKEKAERKKATPRAAAPKVVWSNDLLILFDFRVILLNCRMKIDFSSSLFDTYLLSETS